jgi:hypothetical protein
MPHITFSVVIDLPTEEPQTETADHMLEVLNELWNVVSIEVEI